MERVDEDSGNGAGTPAREEGRPAHPARLRGSRPVILAVDDDRVVLAAVSRDLRAEFGADYRIVTAGSGPEALERLRELRARRVQAALLLVDQRMPRMTGVEMLREAIALFPAAKRVLLTAYADTEVAIRAINDVRLDHYLLKPWSPPEEHLYPVLRELLDDWRAGYQPAFEGVRLVGHRWSARGHELRDFLARNMIPYRWIDVEADAEGARLLASVPAARHPVAFFPDDSYLVEPGKLALAERLGLPTTAGRDTYDLVIVGGGPAGLAAAVYGASEGLKTVVVDQDVPGGQAAWSASIENYLGFPVGLSGRDLARRAVAQARRFGAEILAPVRAERLESRNGYHTVSLSTGAELQARAVLVATGVSYRLLEVPGADALTGAGIYYGAALTEALAARDEDVFVLGGGNSAGQAAIYLARYARSVTVLARSPTLSTTMSRYLVEELESAPNVRVRTRVELLEARGTTHLESLTLRDLAGGGVERFPAHALFVFIGASARTDWLGEGLARDAHGFIAAGPELARGGAAASWPLGRDPLWLETSVPGVFVAGDVRKSAVRRVASAVGDGAMAVQLVHQHLGGGLLRPGSVAVPPAADRPGSSLAAPALAGVSGAG
jgi:thioredoxin reductase (NADPH)